MQRFTAVAAAMSLREIAAETRLNRRTVVKYLSGQVPVAPPKRAPGSRPRPWTIDEFAPLIDAMLRAEVLLKGTAIHERLVADYGFTGNYQRGSSICKKVVRRSRPRWASVRRAGRTAPPVYSFHMTLSYSRDPFCCFTTGPDLVAFFDCHRRAFEHFGGVPMSIVHGCSSGWVRL